LSWHTELSVPLTRVFASGPRRTGRAPASTGDNWCLLSSCARQAGRHSATQTYMCSNSVCIIANWLRPAHAGANSQREHHQPLGRDTEVFRKVTTLNLSLGLGYDRNRTSVLPSPGRSSALYSFRKRRWTWPSRGLANARRRRRSTSCMTQNGFVPQFEMQ
jgi:hypothetical protein